MMTIAVVVWCRRHVRSPEGKMRAVVVWSRQFGYHKMTGHPFRLAVNAHLGTNVPGTAGLREAAEVWLAALGLVVDD